MVKDPATGEVTGVRGYGDAAQQQLDAFSAGHAKRCRTVLAGEPTTFDPTTHVRVEYDKAEVAQGLAKVAYLTAVWTYGDASLDTPAGEAFRTLIFAASAQDALAATTIRVLQDDQDEQPFLRPHDREHHLYCAVANDALFVPSLLPSSLSR